MVEAQSLYFRILIWTILYSISLFTLIYITIVYRLIYFYFILIQTANPWNSQTLTVNVMIILRFGWMRFEIESDLNRTCKYCIYMKNIIYHPNSIVQWQTCVFEIKHVFGSPKGFYSLCKLSYNGHKSRISAWAYLKVVSSLTSPHYLWRSLGPFSLPCAQKWP